MRWREKERVHRREQKPQSRLDRMRALFYQLYRFCYDGNHSILHTVTPLHAHASRVCACVCVYVCVHVAVAGDVKYVCARARFGIYVIVIYIYDSIYFAFPS